MILAFMEWSVNGIPPYIHNMCRFTSWLTQFQQLYKMWQVGSKVITVSNCRCRNGSGFVARCVCIRIVWGKMVVFVLQVCIIQISTEYALWGKTVWMHVSCVELYCVLNEECNLMNWTLQGIMHSTVWCYVALCSWNGQGWLYIRAHMEMVISNNTSTH